MLTKLIITSKQILFTAENNLISENLFIVDFFEEKDIILAILARSETKALLKRNIPPSYKDRIKFIDRTKESEQHIKGLTRKKYVLGLLGVVDEDATFSFRCKIPLFNPENLVERLKVEEKIRKYGLPLSSFQNIVDCYKAYEIHKGNYFQINFGETFNVISLNNANTNYKPLEEIRVKKIFETSLKSKVQDENQRTLLLLLFHLINEVITNPYYEKVNYWGTFPSSNPNNKSTSVALLKESLRCIVGGGPKNGHEILIRKRQMQSKHCSNSSKRLKNKCNDDFDTLVVNPRVFKLIKGKVVCIIDDYITNGYSAESAKHILMSAGVKEVIFLSFGKFGKNYFSTTYEISGDTSIDYTYEFIEEKSHFGNTLDTKNYDSNNEFEILDFGKLI